MHCLLQYWLATSGGRLRFARTSMYLLRHRFSSFVKGNKRNPHKKTGKNLVREGESKQFPKATPMPTSRHFRGTTARETI